MAPAGAPAKPGRPLLRRATVIGLVLLSLALLSVYFRESQDGALHSVQDAGAAVIYPFQVAAERVARPFEDAAGWAGDVLGAESENEKLRAENKRLRQQAIQNQTAVRQNAELRRLLRFRQGPTFPGDYNGVAARIIGRTPGQFEQEVLIAAGSNARVHVNDPVVTAAGLVGRVTRVSRRSARVTLLTDETSAVSALDLKSNAAGIVRPGVTGGEALVLERVRKEDVVGGRRRRDHGRLAIRPARLHLSARDPDRHRHERRPARYRHVQAHRSRSLRGLLVARLRARPRRKAANGTGGEPTVIDGLKVGVIIFVAAVLQASVFSGASILGAAPDILLVAIVTVALVRGATTGAVAGFFGGLVVDVALLETLGVTSLLLTLAGYWVGRYGETTPSRRRYAPYLAVGVMTVLFLVGMLLLRFMLAEPAPAREVLVDTLLQSIALNIC